MYDLADYIRKRQQERPVYMPYLTVGDPDVDSTVEFALAMIDAGADLLELGIPFSDPTADGPVIQAAMVRALGQPDFSLERAFEAARRIHEAHPNVPLIFLSYLNPVLRGLASTNGADAGPRAGGRAREAEGLQRFLRQCQLAGVRGLVLPDLPFDQPESRLLRELAADYDVAQILMVAPNTSESRFRSICKHARGFLYYVTSYGVTGERQSLPPELAGSVDRVRRESGVPVLAGFGISRPEQVQALKSIVDGVIVGSLHHRIIEEHGKAAVQALSETTRAFVQALGSGAAAAPG